MKRFLVDTDHFTLIEQGYPPLFSKLLARSQDEITLSLITLEEAFRGRLAIVSRASSGEERILAYGRLARSHEVLSRFDLTPYDESAEERFQSLRSMKLRVGTQDLKIAANALANSLIVVTRNRRDFARIPGLIIEDWSAP